MLSGGRPWLAPVGLPSGHTHGDPPLLAGGGQSCLVPCCLSPRVRSCGRRHQSRVQRRGCYCGGLGPAGRLPACLLREGDPPFPGDQAGSPFPFFPLGRDCGKGAGAALRRPPLEHCLTALLSSSSHRFSEPPSGVIKSPRSGLELRGAGEQRGAAALSGPTGQSLHPGGGRDAAPEGLQSAPEELAAELAVMKLQTHPAPEII